LGRYKWAAGAVVGFVMCLGGLGCGGGDTKVEPTEAPISYQRLRAIQRAYMQATRELQRPPQNAQDILPYLHYKGEGGPAALLRSPDDGEPYQIFWGTDPLRPREDGQLPILACEQRGKDGARYLMDAQFVRRKTDEEFKEAPLPPGH
jgi:hypothetical protein